jgi:hypothetical protein
MTRHLTKCCLLAIILLSGCATPYQQDGLRGGYSERQIVADTYHVLFRGNGFISQQTVELYLLYRSAELTVEKGYDFFAIPGLEAKAIEKITGQCSPPKEQRGPIASPNSLVVIPPLFIWHSYHGTADVQMFKAGFQSNTVAVHNAKEIMTCLQQYDPLLGRASVGSRESSGR